MTMKVQYRRLLAADRRCLDALGGMATWAGHLAPGFDAFLDMDEAQRCAVNPGDEVFVLFDQRLDTPIAFELQKRVLATGGTLVFVGMEPGSVQIGPVVGPDTKRCLQCLVERIRTNHPNGKAFDTMAPRSRPAPCRPLSPIASSAVLALIFAKLGKAAGDASAELPSGTYYAVRTDTLEISCHRFMQVTGCPCCDTEAVPVSPQELRFEARIKRKPTDKRPPNPALSLRSLRKTFVDRRCGLIKHVFQNLQSDLMPLFTSERPFQGGNHTDYNHGRAFNYHTSELISILEGVERYAGNEPRDGIVALRGSRAQMVARFGERVVDPSIFILHTEGQREDPAFRFEAYTDDLECGWVWGHSLCRREPILVPEQLGYYNIKSKPGIPANRFVYDSSNGCALGGSLEDATLGGLHEVIERDAYFSTWYSRVSPVRIDIDSVEDRHSAALIARSKAAGFQVHLFDMTSEARIPVVGAMIVDPAEDAKVKSYCASACDGRWNDAIFAALAEVTTSMGVYRKNDTLDVERARAMFEDGSQVKEMFDHVLLYTLNESLDRLRFLLDGEVRTLAQCRERYPDAMHLDLTEELQAECAKVLEMASDIIIVDQTFGELRELGLSAAKVLVPGLLPVTFGHQYRRVDLGRLDRYAHFRGKAHAKFTAESINPYPHNFP